MTQPRRNAAAINSRVPVDRKSTQRERLITGMITVADRDEYAGASVSAVTTEAKVSKPTFYNYFRDRDDCFIAALQTVHARLLEDVQSAIADAPPEDAATVATQRILEFSRSEPELTRFMTNEPLAGGRTILDARDEALSQIADVIEARFDATAPDAPAPDLPMVVVVGGLYRLLGARARRSRRPTDAEVEELTLWIRGYNVPRDERRWHKLQPSPAFARLPVQAAGSLRAPEPLPPGRPTLSAADVAENQRLRIVFAAGHLTNEKGVAAVTVTELAKVAQVDLRVFYSLFANKQEVFFALHEHGFKEAIALSADAFVAGASWPEHGWAMGVSFLRFLDANPEFANVGFIQTYAAGREVAQRIDDSYVAFTMFLQEGLHYATTPHPPTPVAMDALTRCYFEAIYRQLRAGYGGKLVGFRPNIASLALTPFLGPAETNRFIDEQLSVAASTDP